jgi:tetratricopeptide (TPR) repeat protein
MPLIRMTLIFSIACFYFFGCAQIKSLTGTQTSPEKKLLPENIYQQPQTNYYEHARVGIFRFKSPDYAPEVGLEASHFFINQLKTNRIFLEIFDESNHQDLRFDYQISIARQKNLDLIIIGKVPYYFDGSLMETSRVDTEITVLNVMTREVIWSAKATTTGSPTKAKEFIINWKKAKEAPQTSELMMQNAVKFNNLLTWVSPKYASLSKDAKQVNNGYHHLASKNYERALYHFKHAIDINRRNANAYFNMGLTYEILGRVSEAIQMYQEVIELNPRTKVTNSRDIRMNDRKMKEVAEERLHRLEDEMPSSG